MIPARETTKERESSSYNTQGFAIARAFSMTERSRAEQDFALSGGDLNFSSLIIGR